MQTTLTRIHDPAKAKAYFEAKLAFTTGPGELERMIKSGDNHINCVDVREAERQTAPPQHRRRETLAAKGGKLFDNARHRAIGEVEAAVRGRVVVPALALVRPREPEGTVRGVRCGALLPRQAPVQDHANESERSARIARRPARAGPIG